MLPPASSAIAVEARSATPHGAWLVSVRHEYGTLVTISLLCAYPFSLHAVEPAWMSPPIWKATYTSPVCGSTAGYAPLFSHPCCCVDAMVAYGPGAFRSDLQ